MSGEITVRAGSAHDLEQLMRLAGACAEAPQWTPTIWRQVLASSEKEVRRHVLVVEKHGEMVGLGVASSAEEVAEIESVAVDPVARRQGVGRYVCAALLEWVRERGAGRVVLEVRVSNHAARALYRALGFQEQGVRRRYYEGPVEDAMIMALELSR